ncbi:MAG: DNA methyltransferase [Candidatus Hadarchaeales archaeon]
MKILKEKLYLKEEASTLKLFDHSECIPDIKREFSFNNRITLYLGDCLNFLKTIPDGAIQLVVTSPPYNIGKEYEKRLNLETYVDQQSRVIEECVRTLRGGGVFAGKWETTWKRGR